MATPFSRTTRALAGDTSRLALGIWLAAGVMLLCWFIWFGFGRVAVYEISRQARLEVRQAPHALASLLPGRVIATSMAIGQVVEAGDVLVELDASSETLRLKEEETRLAVIPPKIKSLKQEIDLMERARADDARSAQAALDSARSRAKEAAAAADFAKDNERRLREESVAGGVARVEALRAATEAQKLGATRDAVEADARRAESDAGMRARQQQAQIENLHRTVVALEGEEQTVRATIERLRVEIANRSIRAPIAGRIGDAVPLRAGAYVAEGQKLATIVPGGELVIVADFTPATALGRLQAGQDARMRLEGFPWTQYGTIAAKVSRVASEIRDGQIRVEFNVEPPAGAQRWLQHGLPGSVEVSVEQVSPAVLVLRAAGQMLTPAPQIRDDVRPTDPKPAGERKKP